MMRPFCQWNGYVFLPRQEKTFVESEIIQSNKEYDRFLRLLPLEKIQKKQPAPPNPDPMLQRPDIDFTTHQLLVLRSTVWSEYPKLLNVVDSKTQRKITYTIEAPDNRAILAQTY